MNILFLFGMSAPSTGGMILSFSIIGLIGFALCYIHRYLVFAVVPLFVWLSYNLIGDLSQNWYSSTQKELGYFLILLDFSAIIFGTVLSWRKYQATQITLK